jgi:hypothetical protein
MPDSPNRIQRHGDDEIEVPEMQLRVDAAHTGAPEILPELQTDPMGSALEVPKGGVRGSARVKTARYRGPCWLYIAQPIAREVIKIGATSEADPARKLASLRRQYAQMFKTDPVDFRLLAIFRGTWEEEEDLLIRFRASLAAGGEWFHPSKDILDFAAAKGMHRFNVPVLGRTEKRVNGLPFDTYAVEE